MTKVALRQIQRGTVERYSYAGEQSLLRSLRRLDKPLSGKKGRANPVLHKTKSSTIPRLSLETSHHILGWGRNKKGGYNAPKL